MYALQVWEWQDKFQNNLFDPPVRGVHQPDLSEPPAAQYLFYEVRIQLGKSWASFGIIIVVKFI